MQKIVSLEEIKPKTSQFYDQNHVKGSIHKIIFQKENFIIAVIRTKNKNELKIKGSMLSPQTQIEYTFTGKWQSNEKYGETFAFTEYSTTYPKELSAVRDYLIDNCKWVGFEVGTSLVNTFKENTLETCKNNPELVASEIRGITIPRAKEISDMLKNNEANEELMIKLKNMLLDTKTSKRSVNEIIMRYGGDAVAIIEENPYRLIGDIDGIGFLTADRIARNSKLDYKSPERIEAGIIHTLKESANQGHTYLPKAVLTREVIALLNTDLTGKAVGDFVSEKEVREIIDNMLEEKEE